MIKKVVIIFTLMLFIIITSIILPPDNLSKSNQNPLKKAKDNSFSLNFNDVEISEFINIMSQLLGKNIILSDKVKGKITISSAQKVPVTEAFNLMKTILEIKGFAVIETDNLIKIIPIKDAVQKNFEVIIDGEKIRLGNDKAVTYLLEILYGDAAEISTALKALKSADADVVLYKNLNTIIITGNSNEVKGLIKIAKSLDKKPETDDTSEVIEEKDTPSVHVVHLENADATSLAEVLSRIPFSQNSVINTQPLNQAGINQANPVTTNIPATTNRTLTQSTTGRNLQTGSMSTTGQNLNQKLYIIPNKETNSLVINAPSREFKDILNIIKQLDIVRPQVMLEAVIMELEVDSDFDLGVEWYIGGGSGKNLVGGSSIMGSVPSYSTSSSLQNKTLMVPATANSFSLGYMRDSSYLNFILLNASQQDKKINVLSTPHILTIDNHQAEINVGEEIAVSTNNRISDTTNTIYYTYEYKPVGLKLKITPHITKGEKITLEFYLEVNSVNGTTTALSNGSVIPPDLAKKDIQTKISVYNGTTIVIGGLMKNSKKETETKVPLLGDIPLLGWLFKNKVSENSKTNLLVFITPKVVVDPEKIKKITEEKSKQMNEFREQNK